MAAYAARMEDALSRCTAGMTARQQAVALYLWVIDNLHYELDMQLTVYDAVTTGAAYCQTYSMLFQQLLTQVGIASYQVGGSVDTDGDGVADAEHQWNRLLLDGEWVLRRSDLGYRRPALFRPVLRRVPVVGLPGTVCGPLRTRCSAEGRPTLGDRLTACAAPW